MPLLRSILDFVHRAVAWVIRSSIDCCFAYWRAIYRMVESTPTAERTIRQYILLGWAHSPEEAERKINFQMALGLALILPMFTIVPLIFALLSWLFDATLGQLSK